MQNILTVGNKLGFRIGKVIHELVPIGLHFFTVASPKVARIRKAKEDERQHFKKKYSMEQFQTRAHDAGSDHVEKL
jgi:hypothetical protein